MIRLKSSWTGGDKDDIWRALHKSHAAHLAAGNVIAKLSDPAVAFQRLMLGEQPALITDGYLVVYDVGPIWSGTVKMVNELYVVGLGDAKTRGPLSSVVKALMAVAEAEGAHGVCVGNASGDNRLSRFYKAQGFVGIGDQFYKEL